MPARYNQKKPINRKNNKVRKMRMYRRTRIGKVLHATAKSVMDITLNVNPQVLTVATTAAANVVFSPSLSSITSGDLSAYQALYDEFKIRGFTYELRPRGNISTAIGPVGFQIYHVLDFTDDTALSTVSDALEYNNCKKSASWKRFRRYVPCMCPQLIKDVNNNPMLITVRPRWMQTTSQTIGGTAYNDVITAVIGAKFISDANPSASTWTADLYVKLHVSFRNKK